MFKKKKKQDKRIKVIGIILGIALLLVISFYMDRKTPFIESAFKDISLLWNRLILYPITHYNDDKCLDQSNSKLIDMNQENELKKEVEELKGQLELNRTLTEFESINATILSRNKSYWLQNLTIDKGKASGIEKDMAVVTKNGFIGKISKVYRHSSEVKLVSSDDVNYKISVSIKVGEVDQYGILNGYDGKTNLLKVIGVDKDANVEIGTNVLTSGLGSMFPSGIYIGKVEKVETDKYNLSKTLYVKTEQNFNDIHYVTVLKVKR